MTTQTEYTFHRGIPIVVKAKDKDSKDSKGALNHDT